MSLALDLFARDGKTSYRVAIGRRYESTAVYEISTTDVAEARAFLLTYVKEQSAKVEVTVTASGDDVYRLLGAEPPRWTPPTTQT